MFLITANWLLLITVILLLVVAGVAVVAGGASAVVIAVVDIVAAAVAVAKTCHSMAYWMAFTDGRSTLQVGWACWWTTPGA